MTRGTWIALGVVAVVLVGVAGFFLFARKQESPDPLAAGVGGALGVVNNISKIPAEIVSVPVRVANDAISVVETPFKAIGKIF